ncbi:MAG: hypothetical protein LUE11_13245 [Clostridia bacterium]|nr:hypothetical protein [Clostridia bacterium]
MLHPQMYPLFELSAEIKAELYPILLFFGMFFVVLGFGGVFIRHLPRKPGSMLDEILSENWEEEDDWDYENRKPKEKTEQMKEKTDPAEQPEAAAELPEPEENIGAAEESDRK